jgi:hypothetical protein
MSAVFDHTVEARLIAEPPAARTLTAALRYDSEDPLAIRLLFSAEASLDGAEVTWAFSRDLLHAGLLATAGEGDVLVSPHGEGRTVIELLSEQGVAVLEFATSDLRRFLRCSYDAVPAGREHEHLDLETGLEALLREV